MRAAAAAAVGAVVAAVAGSGGTPGVTSSSILLGGTVPLSGNASSFGVVGPSAAAYFAYVNAHGGVHGRKIKYVYKDDGYDPSRTTQETRELVQQEKVFAIFNSVGTEHNVAIRPYLNAAKVPQLFVGTGASTIGNGYKKYRWTIGYLPSFFGEGAIYGRYIARNRPHARIGVLYENSDYGKDLLNGLKKGLGSKAKLIVAKQSYEVTDSDVKAQIAKLKQAKANTFMVFALPTFAIQSFVYSYQIGWRPKIFVSSVSVEPTIMKIARLGSHGKTTEGAMSIAFVKDPTSALWARDPAVKLYRRILRKYGHGLHPEDVYNWYGMTVAFTMVDALRHAGRNLTRDSILKAATHLDERNNPFVIPGVVIHTSPTDYFPISKAKLIRYHGTAWQYVGRLVDARG